MVNRYVEQTWLESQIVRDYWWNNFIINLNTLGNVLNKYTTYNEGEVLYIDNQENIIGLDISNNRMFYKDRFNNIVATNAGSNGYYLITSGDDYLFVNLDEYLRSNKISEVMF